MPRLKKLKIKKWHVLGFVDVTPTGVFFHPNDYTYYILTLEICSSVDFF